MSATSKTLIRQPEVMRQTSLSNTTIFHAVRAGTFPSPVPIGPRSKAWLQSEISAWIEARVKDRANVERATEARRARDPMLRHRARQTENRAA